MILSVLTFHTWRRWLSGKLRKKWQPSTRLSGAAHVCYSVDDASYRWSHKLSACWSRCRESPIRLSILRSSLARHSRIAVVAVKSSPFCVWRWRGGMVIVCHGSEFHLVRYFVTQEGATDDDGVPEVGTLLPGLEQRGAPEAHSGTESRS